MSSDDAVRAVAAALRRLQIQNNVRQKEQLPGQEGGSSKGLPARRKRSFHESGEGARTATLSNDGDTSREGLLFQSAGTCNRVLAPNRGQFGNTTLDTGGCSGELGGPTSSSLPSRKLFAHRRTSGSVDSVARSVPVDGRHPASAGPSLCLTRVSRAKKGSGLSSGGRSPAFEHPLSALAHAIRNIRSTDSSDSAGHVLHRMGYPRRVSSPSGGGKGNPLLRFSDKRGNIRVPGALFWMAQQPPCFHKTNVSVSGCSAPAVRCGTPKTKTREQWLTPNEKMLQYTPITKYTRYIAGVGPLKNINKRGPHIPPLMYRKV